MASLPGSEPNCVLMDQHMPSLNGLDVLKAMRKDGLSVPVIIITGLDQPGLREECLEGGVAAYLVKPLEASVVSMAIEAALAA